MEIKKIIKFKNKHRTYIYLFLIFLLALFFRLYGLNWDSGYYFHPDERAIVMFVTPLKWPTSIHSFFSPQSTLNPHFFAYGTFPLYLLKILSQIASIINPIYSTYTGMYIVGRILSAFFDTLSVFTIFLIGERLFSKKAGLLASLLYALSVFPIQSSHFYTVDSLLTFFITLSLLILLHVVETPTVRKSFLLGLVFGLSLATKISALILGLSILLSFILILSGREKVNFKHLFLLILSFAFSSFFFFVVTQPYVVIDFKEFVIQTLQQSQMSDNAFIFPYTLQYVGKIPYLYEIKNIFLWGQGPIIASINLLGLIFLIYKLIKNKLKQKKIKVILIFYVLSYFLVFGHFAVGWMRYMLPIYPALCIFGGWLIVEVINNIPKKYIENYFLPKISLTIFIIILLIYPLSFSQIYTVPNTRIQASVWINKQIPYGSTIAIEHWDDALPVFGQQNYIQLTLPLYDPDTLQKWQNINGSLSQSQYIIIASNRLYVPLQRLTDCNKLPQNKCYPLTSQYYKNLFEDKLGFKKVAEFTDYPKIPFLNIPIIDDKADESFTVYDHPKIMIFKKN